MPTNKDFPRPRAWVVFAESGDCVIWSRDLAAVQLVASKQALSVTSLYDQDGLDAAVKRERESRQRAQIENEELKERLARAGIEARRAAREAVKGGCSELVTALNAAHAQLLVQLNSLIESCRNTSTGQIDDENDLAIVKQEQALLDGIEAVLGRYRYLVPEVAAEVAATKPCVEGGV